MPDKYGFPRCYLTREKIHFGYQTGDMVRAVVSKGKKAGTYIGRVAVRKSGYFDITTKCGRVGGISYRYCRLIQKSDGNEYNVKALRHPPRG